MSCKAFRVPRLVRVVRRAISKTVGRERSANTASPCRAGDTASTRRTSDYDLKLVCTRRLRSHGRELLATAVHRGTRLLLVRARSTTIEKAQCRPPTYASEAWTLGERCPNLLQ